MSTSDSFIDLLSATEQRYAHRTTRRRQHANLAPKRILADNDLLSTRFLKQALTVSRAVVRILIRTKDGKLRGYGTGFLISPRLLLTNNHVLGNAEAAGYSQAEFNYELGENNQPEASLRVTLDPASLFLTDEALDYTLVAVSAEATMAVYGWLPLHNPPDIKVGQWVNIIQHPSGEPKQLALRDNQVIDAPQPFLHYRTDTSPGSSGSPVFTDQWEVVALHHSGVPLRDDQGRYLATDGSVWTPDMGEHRIAWKANEGVLLKHIIAHIQQQTLPPEQQALLAGVFSPVSAPVTDDSDLQSDLAALTDSVDRDYYDAETDQAAAASYYATIQTDADPEQLFQQLSDLVRATHRKTFAYKPSTHVYPWVDLHPDRKLRSIYSGETVEAETFIREDFRIDQLRAARLREFLLLETSTPIGREQLALEWERLEAELPYNCEHVVPQSWFQKKEPMRGDLHHLFACESRCNSFRGNIPYFDFADYEEVVRDGCGKLESNQFEPAQGKGTVARATLYFLLRYPRLVGDATRELQRERLPTLLAWHTAFPPDEYEFHRNAVISGMQGNRNPLIDHPEWAEKVDFAQGMG